MKILAIETSCDETAVTILEASGEKDSSAFTILGDALYSQAKLHEEYGGVYPSLAKREHQKNLAPLATVALKKAGLFKEGSHTTSPDSLAKIRDEDFKQTIQTFLETTQKPVIDLIAVTNGPGLEPALWTGINFAEALGAEWDIPVIGVDHMEGHIMSAVMDDDRENEKKFSITDVQFPLLALLISGGHTEFILMKEWFTYELIGKTKDDAVGEAFDKVARILGLPYPGGPEIQKHAVKAREANRTHDIVLPRPMAYDDTCDFSFSGLKTAVLYKVRDMPTLSAEDKENFAEAFEDAARDIIVLKTRRALEKTEAHTFAIGGGVSANVEIRRGLEALVTEEFPETAIVFPNKALTGDNAIMIGVVAYLRHITRATESLPLTAHGSQSLAGG